MPYDYGASYIAKATGLTGVEAKHIANKLKNLDVDPYSIDWEGAISDARDYGNRYEAVQKYIANYYGVNVNKNFIPSYQQEKYEHASLVDQVSTKAGVKAMLKEYYSTGSNKKKETIKDMLLSEGPLYNVLMTAMYNGHDMPYAKKFLKEAMGEEPVQAEILPVKQAAPIMNVQPKKTDFSVDIQDVYKALQEPKKEDISVRVTYSNGRQKPKKAVRPNIEEIQRIIVQKPDKNKKSSFKNVISAGIKKESDLWRNIFSAQTKKFTDPEAALRQQIKKLEAENLPIQLKLERERLLMRRQQLIALQQLHKQRNRQFATREILSFFGFMPQQQPYPISRPGYYIESRPKLPPGYRWKKIPKGRKKK